MSQLIETDDNILVFGGSGFLGRHLIGFLEKEKGINFYELKKFFKDHLYILSFYTYLQNPQKDLILKT